MTGWIAVEGGYLASPTPFDPASHGIMPNAVDGGEPEQFLVLDTARLALEDAGLVGGIADGRRVEVVIGRGNYFNRGNLTRLQHGRIVAQTVAILESLHPEWTEAVVEAIRSDLKASLPPFGPSTVPGQFTNATAGRVADRLGLAGASYVVDAASASSLVALDLASRSLAEGRADLALVGGVYLEVDVDFPLVFRQLGALSRSGRARPFSRDADGTVSGEGVGVVVLKRREVAERDGDRIYATIRGVGVASDGRGRGLASPSATGHARAIRRAYRSSGIDPASVGMIEGHGLGVPAADRAELRAIRACFPPTRRGRRVLGAVSSMIGHAMPAAGMAGLIKTALSLHHKILPPTLHADRPHPLLKAPDASATLNKRVRPWVHGDPASPRRAGVNAFGFAGINAHAVLEEHEATARNPRSPGALLRWDSEAILLAADDRPALIRQARSLLGWLDSNPAESLKDVAYTLSLRSTGDCRIGLVATSLDDLTDRLRDVVGKLEDPSRRAIRDARGAYFWVRAGEAPPRVAFLFPGEGSQYPGMLGDLCPHFPEVRELFDTSDRIARESGAETWPSETLFGETIADNPTLWSAGVAVNVVLSAQWALYRLLMRLEIRPDAVLGHSSGELLALAAAGVVEVDRAFENKLGDLGAIFEGLEASGLLPEARLVALATSREKVEAAIRAAGADVEVAMDNCPHQVVIAGGFEAVEAVVMRLRAVGTLAEDLPFARAYHTPGFAPAVGPIREFFGSLDLSTPRIPLYSCAIEGKMPSEPESIRRLAVDQWTATVGFRRAVEAMHADGLDVFVDVGARGNLAGFVEDTLRGKSAFAIAANVPRRSGLTQLNHLVASLFARGVNLKAGHLYAGRRPRAIDFEAPRVVRPVPSLQVGFPEMKLSEGLIERLRSKPEVDRNGHHKSNGHPHPATTDRPPFDLSSLFDEPESDPTLVAFQETMAAFLQTQRSVMDAYRGSDGVETIESIPSVVTRLRVAGVCGTPQPRSSSRVATGAPGLRSTADPCHPIESAGPWAGELVSWSEGTEAISVVTLDAIGDPVAEHHTLGGRRISSVHREWRGLPVLPFSLMAEMLAEAAARLVPGKPLLALLDVQAHKWIRYEDEPISLEVRSRVEPGQDGAVRVSIHNRGPARSPREVEAAVFEGVVVFGEARADGPIAPEFALSQPDVSRFTAGSIYDEQWLFHGPTLRAVSRIGAISMGGIEGSLRVLPLAPLLREGEDPLRLLTDPIILDNFTHLLGAWGLDRLADDGDVIFPLKMEELRLFGDRPSEGSDVECRIVVEELERHRVRVNADIIGPDGRTWMTIRGWEDWRFHWPGRFRDGFRHPDRAFLGEPLELSVGDDRAVAVWLEPPADMGRGVWRDVLEHVQMGPDERLDYLKLPGPDSRRTHRLWGRIAAKEAARRLGLARGGPSLSPADLLIEPGPLGRPVLRSRLQDDDQKPPAISIAHVDGVAVALACADSSRPIGIDVEPIVPRSSGFESTAFSAGERALLDIRGDAERAEWVARFWCAKEATAKATGLGFVDGPSGAEVVSASENGMIGVRLRGGLLDACPALAGRTIRVESRRRGDFAWAWTLGEGVD